MKKQILNLGKALSKAEQKSINGGALKCSDQCSTDSQCGAGNECFKGPCLGAPTWMCRKKGALTEAF